MPKHTFQVARLRFTAPLHIGSVRDNLAPSETQVHSDTLYAAIMHVWAMLGYEVPKEPPFAISSLFPYTQSGKGAYRYFLPLPLFRNEATFSGGNSTQNPKYEKQQKKVAWVDTSAFEQMAAGKPLPVGEFDAEILRYTNLQGAYYSSQPMGEVYKARVTPRATISRDGDEDTQIFYIERLHFASDAGLYLLYQADTPETEQMLKNALDVLQDEGIGTDRTVGNGFFRVSYDNLTLALPEPSGLYTNLSLFCPESADQLAPMLAEPACRWDTLRRGGWITANGMRTLRKQDTTMLREGSVLHLPHGSGFVPQLGVTRDVTPEIIQSTRPHPIYRTGKALFVPIHPITNNA